MGPGEQLQRGAGLVQAAGRARGIRSRRSGGRGLVARRCGPGRLGAVLGVRLGGVAAVVLAAVGTRGRAGLLLQRFVFFLLFLLEFALALLVPVVRLRHGILSMEGARYQTVATNP